MRCEELRRELGSSAPVVGAPAAAPAQAPVQKPRAANPSAFKGAAPERASRPGGVGSVLGLAIFCALVLGVYLVRHRGGGAAVEALTTISLVGVDVSPEISPPALERLSTVSQLDAIFYDFDRGGGAREAPRKERVPSPVAPAVGVKAAVDTAGPLEPVDVLKARTQPEEPPEEDVGAILFGAPKPQFPGRYGSGRGGVTPQPVERFTDVKNYTVLSRTRVMSRPSFTGIEMAELSVGDSVRAEGSVGDWLRIRSRNGQVGYILSQDVQTPR